MDHIRSYLEELHRTLDDLPIEQIEQVIQLLEASRREHRQVFIMGNGGSASTASHFVCDLAKNTRRADLPRFCAIGLTDNMAIFSAYANDEGYENAFAQQLANLVHPGDVVIGISASGNSPNVLRAIELANEVGATTIGFTGFDGGRLASLVDVQVHVPSNVIEHVEDAHLSLEHMICKALREDVRPMSVHQPTVELLSVPVSPARTPSVSILPVPAETARPDRARTTLELLANLSRELEQHRDLPTVIQRVLRLALHAVGASSGSLIVLGADATVVEAVLAYGDMFRTGQGLEETVRHGLAGWVVENRQPALVASTLDDPRWLRRAWEQQDGHRRAAASVPLLAGGRVVGVLTVIQRNGSPFTHDDLVLLMAIASCVSLSGAEILEMPQDLRREDAASVHPYGDQGL